MSKVSFIFRRRRQIGVPRYINTYLIRDGRGAGGKSPFSCVRIEDNRPRRDGEGLCHPFYVAGARERRSNILFVCRAHPRGARATLLVYSETSGVGR